MRKIFFAVFLIAILFGCQKVSQQDPGSEVIAFSQATNSSRVSPPPPSVVQWQRALGSTATEYPLGNVLISAPDGGYVIAGNTLGNDGDVSGNHGGVDAWVIKLNSSNVVEWKYTYGGSTSDYAYALTKTSDGGYIFAGQSKSTDGDVSVNKGGYDVWVVKLNASGTRLWQKTYGGAADDAAYAIIQTSDGGYLVAAGTQSNDGDVTNNHGGADAWIIKLDAYGALSWQKTYGGSLNENVNFILPVSANNYMLSASSKSIDGDLSSLVHHGGADAWIFKIDDAAGGSLLWGKTYGGSGDEGAGTIFSTTGGYLFSTTTSSNNLDVSGNHGYFDTWVVKIATEGTGGNIIWQKCYGGTDMDNARIRNINVTTGQIFLVGYTFSRVSKNGDITATKGGEDLWTLLLDPSGTILNSKNLGGTKGDSGEDAIATFDDMYLATGRTESNDGDVSGNHGLNDLWVVKFKF